MKMEEAWEWGYVPPPSTSLKTVTVCGGGWVMLIQYLCVSVQV